MSKTSDDVIFDGFGPKLSFKISVLFCIYALIVSVTPVCIYNCVHHLGLEDYAILFGVVTLLSAYLIFYAYKNTKFALKHNIVKEREDAVRKEINLLANDKKLTREKKEERILSKVNDVADYEATFYSIFFNNALFFAIYLFCSLVFLRSFQPTFNYVLSVGSAAGLAALLSTGTK